VRGATYQLVYDARDSWYLQLQAGNGKPVADLFIASSLEAGEGVDETEYLSSPAVHRGDEGVEISFRANSSLWRNKEYIFRCFEDGIEYFYRVRGGGSIHNCRFFEGVIAGDKRRVGYGLPFFPHGYQRPYKDFYRGSRAYFRTLFNPEPNWRDKRHFHFWEYSVINVQESMEYHGGNGIFTPAPFCFALASEEKEWLAVGLGVPRGTYNFVDFEYQGGEEFGFNLTYQGQTTIEGKWETPHMVFLSGPDEYKAVERYIAWLREHGYVRFTRRHTADWWWEPIFNGWGEQCVVAQSHDAARVMQESTYGNYVDFLALLKTQGINPGIVIIGPKWMDNFGNLRPNRDRWPDLRGFIERQHQGGRKVLLWFPAWQVEGLPRDECIVAPDGTRLGPDPTLPKYQRRLERRLTELLTAGEGCLNADGCRIEWTATTPQGPASKPYEPYWGAELLYEHLRLITDIAKELKSDALIAAPTPNPYFAEVVDMVYLGPLYTDRLSVVDSMAHRARIARMACPTWLIDADDIGPPSLTAWREYMEIKSKFGTPSLAYVTAISATREPLTAEDYALVRKVWEEWRRSH